MVERASMSSQQQIDQIATTLVQLTQVQARTQAQLDSLSVKVDRMSDRVDTFVFEAQRLLTGQADRISKLEGIGSVRIKLEEPAVDSSDCRANAS